MSQEKASWVMRSSSRTSCTGSYLVFCLSKHNMKKLACIVIFLVQLSQGATRLKELVSMEGVRENQLVGYGLVVGLNGTGDRKQTLFSAQSLGNLLQQMGVSVSPTAMRVNNTAGVMVTATLPPFARPGTRIDITAAAIGDASNLQGGLLVMTSLRGMDGQVYAVAQGPVVTGGFVAGSGRQSTDGQSSDRWPHCQWRHRRARLTLDEFHERGTPSTQAG